MTRRIALILFCLLLFIGQAAAIADYHIWDEQNQTATLYKNQQKWITVTNTGIFSDITEHRESLKVTSNYDYSFSALDDFYMGYEIYKGNNKITDLSTTWFLRTTENYNVTVDDYGIVSNWTSKEVFNNQTGINETVWYWDNQTIIIGNHTEPRSRINESIFNPTNKKIDAGQTLTFIKVTRKRAEVGEFFILLKPVFMGASIKELTWWNSSWGYKKPILINNTGNATILTNYQVKLNVTYDTDMNANFSDIRVINDTSGAAVPYWIESKVNSSYANIWFNASSIPASVWTNSTYYLYYGNAVVSDGGSGKNTFVFFDDFESYNIATLAGQGAWSALVGAMSVQLIDGNKMAVTSSDASLKILKISVPFSDSGVSIISKTKNIVAAEQVFFGMTNGTWSGGATENQPGYVFMFQTHANTRGIVAKNGDIAYAPLMIASVTGNYYKLECRWLGTSLIGLKDDAVVLDTTSSLYTSETNLTIGGFGTSQWGYDYIIVRKYVAIEPTATLGTEETHPAEPAQVQVIWWE